MQSRNNSIQEVNLLNSLNLIWGYFRVYPLFLLFILAQLVPRQLVFNVPLR